MSENPSLIGGYELKNCVATGASTQIWEVVQQGSTVPFAMKLLLPDSLKDPEKKAILKHEFKVGSSLEHPNIIRFHRLEMNRDHGFFIMDYFRAPSLKAQLSANLPETQAKLKKIIEAICQAYVHMNEKGWLHRDIKPDNILVNKTGEVRVIDFSLATRIVGGVMKLVGGKQKSIVGTRTYIAPETILKNTPTIQSDVYSLGVTIYEVAVGWPPFAGLSPNDLLKKHLAEAPAPPSASNPNATSELDAVILKMLAKKPKERYADMREVMSAFRNVTFFKEDPVALHDKKVKEAKDKESLSVDKRLDSRADADRVSKGLAAPAKPVKGKRLTAPIGEMEPVRKIGAGKPAAPAPAVAAPQPQAPMMPQMPYVMPPMAMPGMPMVGVPMPGMGMPGMSMPGMPMPGMYPGMMPSAPMMPPMAPAGPPPGMAPQMPGLNVGAPQIPAQPPAVPSAPVRPAPAPAQDAAQNNAPPQSVPAQNPSSTQPSQDSQQPKRVILPLERRAASAAAQAPEAVADLDFMTELPDIM